MKRLITCAVMLVMMMTVAVAAEEPKDRLLRLFNARLSENPRRFGEAMRAVLEDARNGAVLHQFALALVARHPDVPKDVAEELTDEVIDAYRANRTKIELAAKNKGNSFAWYLLALDATDGKTKLQFLHRAAEKNNEQALSELGVKVVADAEKGLLAATRQYYSLRESGASASEITAARNKCKSMEYRLKNARKEAYGYFMRAADKMNAVGCCHFGLCLLNGDGCAKNEVRALGYIKSAAKEGHPRAMSLLGCCYRDGVACPRDLVAAAASFKQSADLGNADGLYNYGKALLVGEGVDRDEQTAVGLMRRAAMMRHIEAMDLYATCLIDGRGFEVHEEKGLAGADVDRAREARAKDEALRRHEAVSWWYHCATECQYAPAMNHLAECFLDGIGVEKRTDAAVYWFYRAAMFYRYIPAMEHMADCCELGLGGLAESHDNANWWRTLARAEAGDRNARFWLGANDPHRFDRLVLAVKE